MNEPDRLSGNFAAGPRVFISREGLEASGSAGSGQPCGAAVSVQGSEPANGAPISDTAVADLKDRLEKLLPEAQVIGLSRDESGTDAGAGSGDESAVADEPGGAGVGCGGSCDGDARASAAAAGHDRDYEVAGGSRRADHQDLCDADAAAGLAGGCTGCCAGGCGAAGVSGAAGEVDQCGYGDSCAVCVRC